MFTYNSDTTHHHQNDLKINLVNNFVAVVWAVRAPQKDKGVLLVDTLSTDSYPQLGGAKLVSPPVFSSTQPRMVDALLLRLTDTLPRLGDTCQ